MADDYVFNIDKAGAPVDAEVVYVHEPGMTDRLLVYEQAFSKLRPKQQARILFSRRFRRALRASRTSQQQLAKNLDVSPSLISSWANAVSMPAEDILDKLTDFFGEDVREWTHPEPEPIPQMVAEKSVPYSATGSVTMSVTKEEQALIQRVRRMSDEERDGLYALLHVLR